MLTIFESLNGLRGSSASMILRMRCLMVTDDTLYVRVDEHNQATFEEARSSPPLNYAKGGNLIDLAFWRVPERLIDEPDELLEWALAALAAAHRVAAKRKRK